MAKTKIIVLIASLVVLAALLAAVVYAQPLLNPNTATPKTGTFSQQLPSKVSSAGTYGTYRYGSCGSYGCPGISGSQGYSGYQNGYSSRIRSRGGMMGGYYP